MAKASDGNDVSALVRTITAEQLRKLLQAPVPPMVLDVRQPGEYWGEFGHVPTARLIPLAELASQVEELAGLEAGPIVTVCRSGGRSSTAAAILTVAGFENVRSLDGGMTRWNELGYPIER